MTRGASIALSDQYAAVPLTRFSESGFVKLKPCSWSTAAKLYSYLRVSRAQTTTVTFHYYGFAVPTFYDFHIRGLPPAPPNPLNPQATDWRTLWSGQQATAHARVGIENFAAPGTFAYHGQDITVSGAAPVFPAKPSYVPKVNGMSIAAPAGDGVFAIEFSVSAYEFYAPDKKTTIDGVIDFETLQLIMDSRYISDRVQCQAAFWKDASQYIPLPPFDFHPQPPEHPGWQEMLAWLAEARQGLAEHASRDGTAVRRIAKALAKQYSAPASLFLESDS
jgi:hypothetical protein